MLCALGIDLKFVFNFDSFCLTAAFENLQWNKSNIILGDKIH